MATKTKTSTTALGEITPHLKHLSQSELIELGDLVAALLGVPGVSRFFADVEEEDDDQVEDQVEKGDKPAAHGHIEAKMINGCGPYLYRRYWEGKTLKSEYIGKAKKA
jgi:hypothetical protein